MTLSLRPASRARKTAPAFLSAIAVMASGVAGICAFGPTEANARITRIEIKRVEQIKGAGRPRLDRIFSGRQSIGIAEADRIHGDGTIMLPEQRQHVAEFVPGSWRLVQQEQRLAAPDHGDVDACTLRLHEAPLDSRRGVRHASAGTMILRRMTRGRSTDGADIATPCRKVMLPGATLTGASLTAGEDFQPSTAGQPRRQGWLTFPR